MVYVQVSIIHSPWFIRHAILPLYCEWNRYDRFAGGHCVAFLILRPAFNRYMRSYCARAIACSGAVLYDAVTGDGVSQPHHIHKTYLELLNVRAGNSGDVGVDELPEEGHAEHAVCNYTIQAHAMGSLFIEMDGIVVTRRIRVAVELLLRNGRLDQRGKQFAGSCV